MSINTKEISTFQYNLFDFRNKPQPPQIKHCFAYEINVDSMKFERFMVQRCQLLSFGHSSYDFTPYDTMLCSGLYMLRFFKKHMFFLFKNSCLQEANWLLNFLFWSSATLFSSQKKYCYTTVYI